MMKPKRVSFTPVSQSTSNIAASQTPGAAGNLTLAGALCSGGVMPTQELGYIIGIGCAADETGRTFTVTGTDQDGKAQTESITGVSTATAVSTKFWRSISAIAVDAATAGAIVVGTVNTTLSAATPTYCVDIYENYTRVTADIGGTANFTIQKCSERPTAGETPNWRTLQAAGTVDVEVLQTGSVGAIRVQINSYTNGATLAVAIAQSAMANC